MTEEINHPERYNGDSVYECIKVLKAWMPEEQYRGFLRGNFIKYVCRLGKKDDSVQELKKASWYLERLIESYESTDSCRQNSDISSDIGLLENILKGLNIPFEIKEDGTDKMLVYPSSEECTVKIFGDKNGLYRLHFIGMEGEKILGRYKMKEILAMIESNWSFRKSDAKSC